MSKQVRSAFQHVMLDEINSDCGSKKYLKVKITSKNKKHYLYRYMKTDNGLKLITNDNIGSLIDKDIEIRSPLYCKGDLICNKCMGDLFYNLGIRNVGVTCDRVSSTIMQKSMKQFHNSSIKTSKINIFNFITKI